jgi:catechol 2,3-dioxygenase-like lactoylglutathione lyase family enzyme
VGVTPTLRFENLQAAVELYTGPLGFEIVRGSPAEGNVAVARDDNRLMLEATGAFYGEEYNAAIADRLGTPGSGALYLEADDLTELYETVGTSGLRVVDPIGDRPWGQTEFTVEDGEGNWLSFWKRLP